MVDIPCIAVETAEEAAMNGDNETDNADRADSYCGLRMIAVKLVHS